MNENLSKNKSVNRVLIVTIIFNILLLILKVVAGITANSTALIADGLHSGSDVLTSVGVIIGIVMAQKPRDKNHHYGHEKIETIVTFLLSIVLIYVGGKIGYSAFISVIKGEKVLFSYFALSAAFVSIVIKELQYQVAFKVGTREQSPSLIADAWHHRSDALSSIASFIGVLGAKFDIYILDGLAGLAVSVIVIKVGVDIFKDCSHQLIDVSIHSDEIDNVKYVIMKKTDVQNISDMRTRKHGAYVLVDIRVCVNPHISVYEGHNIAKEVESIIRNEIENVRDVVVHVDPYNYKDK